MTEEIKLSKFDNEPWGFRLTGGKDFGTVITVIKITQGSLAERAGMKVGDLLVAINDQPLTNLTHSEAHDVIIGSGNNFVLTIVRGSLVLPPPLVNKNLSIETEKLNSNNIGVPNIMAEELENTTEEELMNIATITQGQHLSTAPSPVPVIQVTPPPTIEVQELIMMKEEEAEKVITPINEEELEDMMLGHAEVISGNAIGVDFYKMAPKCEVIEKSDVLQALKEEKLNEAKKTISKFLQHPDRPKVKPKESAPPIGTPYKPLIIIPKKGQPGSEVQNKENQESSEEPSAEEKEDKQTIQQEKQDTQAIQEEQKEQQDQGEQTRPQEQKDQEKKEDHTNELTGEQTQDQANWDSHQEEGLLAEEDEILKEMAAINASLSDVKNELQDIKNSSPQSPEFEKQWKKINEQLVNLLCMPLDMQRYLVQVKKQLDELRRLKNPPSPEPEPEPEPEPKTELEQAEQENVAEKATPGPTPTPSNESQNGKVSPQDQQPNSGDQHENVTAVSEETSAPAPAPAPEPEPEPIPEPEIGPPKHPRRDINWQKDPEPRNRPFFPLTPKPRPVVLPEDAPIFRDNELFSEEFIAETLSGNAEVIQGKAIGVNFLKFKRNYDHLQSSDVYKMIHNEDKKDAVFPTRSGKILSKEDCMERASTKNE